MVFLRTHQPYSGTEVLMETKLERIAEISASKFRQKIRDIKVWLYANRDQPLKKLMGMLNLKLTGHYRYYGISFNGRMISNYKQQVRELLFKVLNRRSDRKSYTREGFIEMLKYYPLAMPKIYVSLF